MSKNIKVGDVVRIFDGVGRGQKQVVRDLIDLPMGTGIVVMLDHGELETLNPANVEVFSADGEPEGDDQEEPSVFMPNADLIRRVKALEKQVNYLEAHLQGHEKHTHEGIDEYLADLNSGQRNIRDEMDQLRKWAYRRFEKIKHTDKAPADETTENIATRDYTSDVWRIHDEYLAQDDVLQASYFLHGAATAMGTTIWRLLDDRRACEKAKDDEA